MPPHTTLTESRTVLLAEDDDNLREVMQAFLEVMGYAVLPCHDAQMASRVFRSGATVDLLLTDIEMPGRSGVELARELTTLSPSLPVLIVSGCFLTTEMKGEMQSRGWAFLSKPFAFPVLLATLHAVLGSSKELAA